MKNKIITFALALLGFTAAAQDFTYSTNLFYGISTPTNIFCGTNSTDTARDSWIVIWNKINADITLLWTTQAADAAVSATNFAATPLATNWYPYSVITSLTPAVALNTPWTNTYGGRFGLIVDGNVSVADGSSAILLTNLTTSESHVIISLTATNGETNGFSYPYEMGTNEVVMFTNLTTGTASATLTQSSGKVK